MSENICDSEFPWCPPDARAGEFYKLRELFGEDAFYNTLEDVVKDYQKQAGAAAK